MSPQVSARTVHVFVNRNERKKNPFEMVLLLHTLVLF